MNLYELIKLQTYNAGLIEWVIIEGSKTESDALQNKKLIDSLIYRNTQFIASQVYPSGRISDINISINYVDFSYNNKLSDLRNIGNKWCSGEIIICMDDDDYYPPSRIEHAVNCLLNSSKLIAGCSATYMYEYDMQKLYKFDSFGDNHSTNNCFAYKREYLNDHEYESGLSFGEEKSFTNGFTEPMIQLDSVKTIVVSSHNNNTFDKKPLCLSGSSGHHYYLHEEDDIQITELVPIHIFNKMKMLFIPLQNEDIECNTHCNIPDKDYRFTSFSVSNADKNELKCNDTNTQNYIEHAWRM
jgi:glycosyltransferase involved in cell wall biosynthesis